ncbi:tetratricopeptide repeat-containing response regulator [Pseudoduganella namucuonensis]|uniref:Tetratricopeptide repeat-containing protein n=1 Tax=Pseudoduganella namucuonensis TaxID=1035707 RepID=A0A1I7HBR8_9BURK|nr:tetratricopeptide repeat-containing response regulator [Pseudoduganella namucuonensis]SFU58153.1 Tetratricopeptide repeat-containing protein [Pseudoduganella namucuonensis]
MQDFAELSVLLVDPNQSMRTSLRNMLNQAGIVRIDDAVSSGTAIRQIAKKTYDLVLCEYDLSGGSDNGQDGQQLLEDLRNHALIGRWTIFIMLTSEGVYGKVVSAAELLPNDYILKPFTVEVLLQRINRAVGKRSAFLPVYQLLDQQLVRDAIAEAGAAEANHPRLSTDFARLRAELHFGLGEMAEAELIYHTILAGRPIGWAHLGLARCQFALQRFEEAQATLDKLLAQNPKYMAAYDLLARTHEALGQANQAKKVLEDAVAISPHMVSRLRHLGAVAYETGDIGVAEKAFKQVVAKAKYSEFRDPEDHVNLVKTLVKKGDANQASSVIRDLERSLRGNSNTEVCRAISAALLMDMSGQVNQAAKELGNAVAAVTQAKGLSNQLRLGLVDSCLKHRLDKDAADVVIDMMNDDSGGLSMEEAVGVFEKAGRHDIAREVGEQINQHVDELLESAASALAEGDHRAAVAALSIALRKKPSNLPVLYATIGAMLRQLDELGWEAPLGEQAGMLLDRLRRIDGANPEFDKLEQQFAGTQRKFGISTTA